jgi:hypothetical protein
LLLNRRKRSHISQYKDTRQISWHTECQ